MSSVATTSVLVNFTPAIVRTAEGSFSVLSDDGYRLWGGRVDGVIRLALVADLGGDRINEVIVGVGSGEDTGKIFVFSEDGKPRWAADTTAPYNYGTGRSGRMAITDLITADLFQKGTRQIVATAIDSQGWLDSSLSIFDPDGKRIGMYWHPGHLHRVVAGAVAPGGPVRISVAGVTNSITTAEARGNGYLAIVFLLDPADVRGEAPPYDGLAGKGSQLWYGVIAPPRQTVERLELVDHDQDRRREISLWTSTGHIFYLSLEGKVVGRSTSDGATGDSAFLLLEEGPPR